MYKSKSLKIQTNVVFEHCDQCDTRILVEQGGTRSGKTYNILTWLVYGYLLRHQNKVVTIVRKTSPSLRATAMRDFLSILDQADLYSPDNHNRTNLEYRLNNNLVEFVSCDSPQKVRGRKRDALFINEANECSREDYMQLSLRTSERIILDYNPSDAYHWIYEEVVPREDCTFYQTTYKDNPFLGASIVAEIERLKEADPDYWRVYGLGERATLTNIVFGHYQEIDTVPPDAKLIAYGLDFGYSVDPSALVAVYDHEGGYVLDECFYAPKMTNADIAREMRTLGITRHQRVIADSAEPKSIDQIHGAGFNVHPARKGPDSVRAGIDMIRSKPLSITKRSINGIKELRSYRWMLDKNEQPMNKPEGVDHFLDAARYVVLWNERNPNYGAYALG